MKRKEEVGRYLRGGKLRGGQGGIKRWVIDSSVGTGGKITRGGGKGL